MQTTLVVLVQIPMRRRACGLSRNGVKNYSKGPCVTILE